MFCAWIRGAEQARNKEAAATVADVRSFLVFMLVVGCPAGSHAPRLDEMGANDLDGLFAKLRPATARRLRQRHWCWFIAMLLDSYHYSIPFLTSWEGVFSWSRSTRMGVYEKGGIRHNPGLP